MKYKIKMAEVQSQNSEAIDFVIVVMNVEVSEVVRGEMAEQYM